MLLNLYAPSSLFRVFFPFLRIQMASLTHTNWATSLINFSTPRPQRQLSAATKGQCWVNKVASLKKLLVQQWNVTKIVNKIFNLLGFDKMKFTKLWLKSIQMNLLKEKGIGNCSFTAMDNTKLKLTDIALHSCSKSFNQTLQYRTDWTRWNRDYVMYKICPSRTTRSIIASKK